MKKQRGGKREGAGRKSGSVKPHAEKRVVRKLYQWTPAEYERISQAVEKSGIMESKIVQTATLEKVESILNERADGEQCKCSRPSGHAGKIRG